MQAANTAFVIIASVLVWFMTPGLAFFYGGLVSTRNVVNTMLSVFYITGVAIMLWVVCGYELSFGADVHGVIGTLHGLFLQGVNLRGTMLGIPRGAYVLFQMMFAIITPALFVGAVVGRMDFRFLTIFIICWSVLVYYPLVHMVWTEHGLLAQLGMLDFAGGTVIHINAGITALILSLFLGARRHPQTHPYNRPWVLLGTAILWIGWYGFNAGSALAANDQAIIAALTTSVGAASAMCAWMLLDVWRKGKPTLLGTCTGALCGLVGITPATGYVTVAGATAIGIMATFASYAFVTVVKPRAHIDDALDAFGCHGVSGIVGSILTGVFASKTVNKTIAEGGILGGGSWHLLWVQLAGTGITIAVVALLVLLITFGLSKLMPMRVSPAAERAGLDISEHGETADYSVPKQSEVLAYPEEFVGQIRGFKVHRD